jgi:hypothetical protein
MGLELQFHEEGQTRTGFSDNPAAVFHKPLPGIYQTRQGYYRNPPRVPAGAAVSGAAQAGRVPNAGRDPAGPADPTVAGARIAVSMLAAWRTTALTYLSWAPALSG